MSSNLRAFTGTVRAVQNCFHDGFRRSIGDTWDVSNILLYSDDPYVAIDSEVGQHPAHTRPHGHHETAREHAHLDGHNVDARPADFVPSQRRSSDP